MRDSAIDSNNALPSRKTGSAIVRGYRTRRKRMPEFCHRKKSLRVEPLRAEHTPRSQRPICHRCIIPNEHTFFQGGREYPRVVSALAFVLPQGIATIKPRLVHATRCCRIFVRPSLLATADTSAPTRLPLSITH